MTDISTQIGFAEHFEVCTSSSEFIQLIATCRSLDVALTEWLLQDSNFVRAFAHFIKKALDLKV
ncbi:hypothetical protein V1517DRAFT_356094 [Lipomyces orientalis]|uniref:Uncharacterized protein n=1 Tax=Lipomyces orientalis TaxID=1233043 RepID=A0ACC3THL0_9ASCO